MKIKRSVTGVIATVMTAGTFAAALTAVEPDVYHDLTPHVVAQQIAAVNSATTSDQSPDVYHDL
jgi:hypothetical protein